MFRESFYFSHALYERFVASRRDVARVLLPENAKNPKRTHLYERERREDEDGSLNEPASSRFAGRRDYITRVGRCERPQRRTKSRSSPDTQSAAKRDGILAIFDDLVRDESARSRTKVGSLSPGGGTSRWYHIATSPGRDSHANLSRLRRPRLLFLRRSKPPIRGPLGNFSGRF